MQYIITTRYTFNDLRFTTVQTKHSVHVGNVIELCDGTFTVGWGLKVKQFATEQQAVAYLKRRFEAVDASLRVEVAA